MGGLGLCARLCGPYGRYAPFKLGPLGVDPGEFGIKARVVEPTPGRLADETEAFGRQPLELALEHRPLGFRYRALVVAFP